MYPKHRSANESPVASPSFPKLEEEVLAYWKKDGTFQESIDQRSASDAPEFVFYDGPPFANGLPHYGHLLTGYTKDLVPRYQTMRGNKVERRFGWDTHGLPAEVEAERLLGISGRPEIEKFGVGKFNEFCRTSVLKYTEDWRTYVTRQARWVDFDNDYKTLDTNYTESVLWAFKQLHNKGLIYEGFKVLAYCWRCETPLSNHELRMDEDVYQDRQDQSVTVTFPIIAPRTDLDGVSALAWTTTPWTLPTNFALAVGPEIEYAIVSANGSSEKFLLAKNLVAGYAKELGYEDAKDIAIEKIYLGKDLAGVRYQRIFDFYANPELFEIDNAWQILVADYVADSDGTGIVHQAPAYGEDDQNVCSAAGIPTYVSINERGEYNSVISSYVGQHVFEANKPITQDLKAMGRLFRQASYVHSYPHCYRCKNPLIYKAVSSWFVETTRLRDRMLELNQEITWVPEHTKNGAFGKWLENVRDWAISRNRFWGAPIPVWKSDDPNYPRIDVYGSLDELEADFGVRPSDFHRPVIDDLVRPNPDDPTGKSMMRRVPEVLDCWFESGSMPFAQVHYPFENTEWFDSHFPGDFIVEYSGQTRGWFYTLHVLSTALFDRPAFKNAISHGIVLGSDGQKMSKSLRNYPDVNEVFNRDGSDAMRWFLMSSPILRGGNLTVTEAGIREGVRQSLLPLWNSYYFFALYANAAGYEASPSTSSEQLLDRYILAKTSEMITQVTQDLDAFDSFLASSRVRDFAEVLTNWYIRRSRDRFWSGDKDAFDTLYTVLEATFRVIAPLLPLAAEEMWRGITNGRSVHLESWPDPSEFPTDSALVSDMDAIREAASVAQSLRKAAKLRVRLPLSELVIASPSHETLGAYADLIADELNVKSVRVVEASEQTAASFGLEKSLSVNSRALGPRVGSDVQRIIKESKAGNWQLVGSTVMVDGTELIEGEYELSMVAAGDSESSKVGITSFGFVLLNTVITPELAAEGLARDAIRHIQQARKDADLDVSDRIVLKLIADEDSLVALGVHQQLIANETLATEISLESGTGELAIGESGQMQIVLAKA
ncbi:MAG: isoleucine--tRNA ligase [Aquiluna sp.]|nr:isoleucine--tRNA ligase [Aquiluna sp.]MCF8545219.1 isoleucine--tRNA ligase [Aquiluna sp.]